MMKKIYRIADLPSSNRAFAVLPIVRAYVDAMRPLPDGNVNVMGWLLLPDKQLDQIEVYLDGIQVMSVPLAQRPDVAAVFKWIPHASTCGFNFILPFAPSSGTSILETIAFNGNTPSGRFSHFVRADIDHFASPTEDHVFRVTHTRDLHFFKLSGLKIFGEFMESVRRHGSLSAMKRILDWGCGCGRVTAHLMAIEDGGEVFGCDIDPFAIEWCNRHLRESAFAVLGPLPPAPYPDTFFDLIVSYSVFTDLARDIQSAWLQEMHRILCPRGAIPCHDPRRVCLLFRQTSSQRQIPALGHRRLVQRHYP